MIEVVVSLGIILGLSFILFAPMVLYFEFGWFKGFYHDVLKWHKPTDEREFDGCSVHSKCKYCGKEIMRDSQGNWF